MPLKSMTGLIATCALIVSFATGPAQAQNDQIKQLIGAAAALYLFGQVLDQASSQPDQRVTRHGSHRHDRAREERRVLPGECVRKTRGRAERVRRFLPRRCLRRHDVKLRRLPERCERSYQRGGRTRQGYALRCLRRDGWQIAYR